MKRILSLSLFLFILGCGGGGGGGSAPLPPELSPTGLWTGLTSDSRELGCLILNNNTLWCIYSPPGQPNISQGFIQGTWSASGNTFTSSNARDFNIPDNFPASGSISGTFTAKQSFSGTVSPSGTTFSLTYDPKFDQAPSLSAIAGVFGGEAAAIPGDGIVFAGVEILTNGALSFASTLDSVNFCNASGAVSPRSGENAFNTSMTFGSGCSNNGETQTGISFYDTATTQLTTLVVNGNRSVGGIFIGFK